MAATTAPSTAAMQNANARPRARSAKVTARAVTASAATVTSTGWPKARPPAAPLLRTRRTEIQLRPTGPDGRAASTSDLLTWSAATTATVIAAMAQRTPADDLTAASAGISDTYPKIPPRFLRRL